MAAAAEMWPFQCVTTTIISSCLVLPKLLLVALQIAQISIGAKYLNECTQQKYIPIYVLVCGVFGISLALLNSLPYRRKDNPVLKGLVYGFTLCWYFAGSWWTYSIYPPNYNSTVVGEPYCNKTLYQFAFWTTTLAYIFLAIFLVGSCCFLIYLCSWKPADQCEEVTQA